MQHSPVLLSSLTTLLGLDPSAAAGAHVREQQGAGGTAEDAFAVLLAAIGAPANGEVLPAGGKTLPPGGAAAPMPAVVDVGIAAGTLPAAAPVPVAGEVPATLQHTIAEQARQAAEAPMPDDALHVADLARAPTLEPSSRAAEVAASALSLLRSAPSQASAAAIDLEGSPAAPMPNAASSAAPADSSAADPSAADSSSPDPLSGRGPAPADAPAVRLRASTGEAASLGLEAAHDPAGGRTEQGTAVKRTEAESHAAGEALRTLSRSTAASAGSEAGASTNASAATPGIAAPSSVPVDSGADVQPSARAVHDGGGEARGASADVGDSVASRIRVMIDHGAGEARLKLNPPELGTIDVRISMVDDKTFVQMTASHAAGRDALEQSLPRLRDLLAAGGLDLGGASVDGGGRDARSESGAGRPDAPYTFVPEAAADAASPAAGAAASAAARASGRIDLFA